ncbi:RNase adapter RapZ [Rubellimicrobium roseum]|uniref:RNase adapter RapZ n=1 Tax=Rubellimicrobium roseum TaxID=687525 RepID=A0A5C4NLS5_9RHOB|nr:RNase adapter RapZ [Rubellimicrobium roseum]TNC74076.1 RNase adapter RapZ [Rubellimicrobium roseum]
MTRPLAPHPLTAEGTHRIVLVTGPSGAGRSTAVRALEDLGYEVIDNLPLSFLPRLAKGPPLERPLALGIDVRNRDFAADAVLKAQERLSAMAGGPVEILFLDCSGEVLLRRFSETRRPHPLAPDGPPAAGIAAERGLLAPLRARADVLIDTSALSPHELRAEVERWFAPEGGRTLAVTVESFSYKQGLPPGLDIVMDCRFLRNPHWDEALRPLDGRDAAVAAYVAADARYCDFFARLRDLVGTLLPAYREEGKAHLAIGLGCTGGQHRSVTVAESLAQALAEEGWRVSIRHRELERRAKAGGAVRGQ